MEWSFGGSCDADLFTFDSENEALADLLSTVDLEFEFDDCN